MAIFNNMVITTKGEALYNKVQAGIPLNFTKMKIGSGQLAEGDNPETFTGLKNYKFDVSISSVTQNTQLQVAVISGTINNTNITEGQYICELGLFAEDPDEGEILYGYANAGTQGDYIAPNNKGAFAWNYQVNAAVGNATEVTAMVSSTTFDYAVASSSATFAIISGTNQKEINESIDTTLGLIQNTVNFEPGSHIATQDNTTSFIIDVPYNPGTDHVELFYLGNQRMEPNDNYTLTGTRVDLVDWSLKSGEKITYNVWKFVNNVPIMADGSNLQDNSVAIRSLTEDVQENVNQVPILMSQMADKAQDSDDNRTTTDKTVTGAINELNNNKVEKTDLDSTNAAVESKAPQTQVDSLQVQLNTLVLAAGSESESYAEIVQARNNEDTMNDRITKIETGERIEFTGSAIEYGYRKRIPLKWISGQTVSGTTGAITTSASNVRSEPIYIPYTDCFVLSSESVLRSIYFHKYPNINCNAAEYQGNSGFYLTSNGVSDSSITGKTVRTITPGYYIITGSIDLNTAAVKLYSGKSTIFDDINALISGIQSQITNGINGELLDSRKDTLGNTYTKVGDIIRTNSANTIELDAVLNIGYKAEIKPIWKAKGLREDTGAEVTDDANICTDFLSFPFVELMMTYNVKTVVKILKYTTSKVFVGMATNAYVYGDAGTPLKVTLEAGYLYRFKMNSSYDISQFHIYCGVSDIEKRIKLLETNPTKFSDWKDKKWISYGDSHVRSGNNLATGTWQQQVHDYFGFAEHLGCGVGGSPVQWTDTTFGWNDIQHPAGWCSWERIKAQMTMAAPDLIFIMGGSNSFSLNGVDAPEGDFTWSIANITDEEWISDGNAGDFGLTTFKGALSSVIIKIQKLYPNAVIVLGTMPNARGSNVDGSYPNLTATVVNALGFTERDYANWMKETAEYWGVEFVDFYGKCQANVFNRANYSTDSVHFNTDLGKKAIGRVAIESLLSIMPYQS